MVSRGADTVWEEGRQAGPGVVQDLPGRGTGAPEGGDGRRAREAAGGVRQARGSGANLQPERGRLEEVAAHGARDRRADGEPAGAAVAGEGLSARRLAAAARRARTGR